MRWGSIVGLAVGLIVGCAHPVAEGLRTMSVGQRSLQGLTVVYDDHHSMWGGLRIEVTGEGSLRVHRYRPGQPDEPEVWHGTVPPERVRTLVELLVEIEAWEQRVEARLPRLDEGRTTLTVRVDGHRERVWEWTNDHEANSRLVEVRSYLVSLVRQARAVSGALPPDARAAEPGE